MSAHTSFTDTLLDRAAGCLIGLATGDALGGPAESLSARQIQQRFGSLTEMVGGGNLDLGPGETSDDTALTLALAESIAERGSLDPEDVARRLAAWFQSGAKGVGGHTAAVLGRVAAGEDWEQAALEVQAQKPKSAGNGSLMRCAPVALLDHGVIDRLIRDSRLSSRITHPHAECQWSCVFLNLVITDLLGGSKPRWAVENAIGACRERGDAPSTIVDRAEWAAANQSGDHLSPSGYVLDTLECALWALLHHGSFEESLVRAVNLGGDADTIGAVTGALAGAAYGFHAIPDRWLDHIGSWWRLQELAVMITEIER